MSEVRGQSEVATIRQRLAMELSPMAQEALSADPAPAATKRKTYWRSIGDLLKAPSFATWAKDEFPQLDEELNQHRNDGPSRRRVLQLMGASIALAGLGASGCRRPEGKILPYSTKPVDTIIGRGMYYATTCVAAGHPIGVLAETHEGRPTKIEGNPLHPNSLGGTDLFAQASILSLYDPDRSRAYTENGEPRTREQFVAFADALAKRLWAERGKGLAILLQEHDSPAMEMVLAEFRPALPKSRVYSYWPLRPDESRQRPIYDLSKAKVILSLDADLLGVEDEGVRYRRQFADGRRVDEQKQMSQLYVVEPAITQTGAIADHRLALPASRVGAFAQALLATLRGEAPVGQWSPKARKWLTVLAETLRQAGSEALVVAGERQGPAVQTLAYYLNRELGSAGKTVRYLPGSQRDTLETLTWAMHRGEVTTLIIAGGNPAYDAPADLPFADLLKKVPLTLRLSLYEDETSALCTWHIPAAHYLESWGDARSSDGTISSLQPMIEPMFQGMATPELLARIAGILWHREGAFDIAHASFKRFAGNQYSEEAWQAYLQEGVWKDRKPVASSDEYRATAVELPAILPDAIEVCFAPDSRIHDGRFANNGWLQECPDPVTKLTWDNAAILGPELAKRLNIQTGDVLSIEVNAATIEAPAYILPGVADRSITLPLGYGRTAGGVIAKGSGFNSYLARTTSSLGFALGAKVSVTGKTYPLATTQEHWAMDLDKHFANVADEQARERAIIREVTPSQLAGDPAAVKKMGEHAPIHLNIYTTPQLTGANQWGMSIDLNACVGCNACVIACQAENNVPIVGKNQVMLGREMHWLRLDRYFTGENNDDVQVSLQPLACQQCENAPCEPVCPVNATVHSPEGLNEMVYNRCIGTRYCSNNCPYKVRRFNFLDWNKGTIRVDTQATRNGDRQPNPTRGLTQPQLLQPPMQEMLKMAENPNVSVRMRGIMEKCTFCVQRIESAKIAVRSAVGQGNAPDQVNGESAIKVPDGMIQTACQQSCPTQAIVFGDKADPDSRLNKTWDPKVNPRSYEVLESLNVRPRTHFLAKVRNVNPKLVEEASAATEHQA